MLSYGRQSISEEDIVGVGNTLRSDYLTCGPEVEKFEEHLCKFTGAQYAVVCSNGTAALHLAAMALDVSHNNLGITTANTFVASSNCIEMCGAKSDFIDIEMDTLCISPDEIEKYCLQTAVPKVVIAVDFAGVPANLPRLRELADRYKFSLIVDCAHSLGSTYLHEGKEYSSASCAHSEMATLSFHPLKNITTGEGGAVLTNNPSLAKKLRQLRAHGIVRERSELLEMNEPWCYEMHSLGFNYRLTDFQCTLGISQINRLPEWKEHRQNLVNVYNEQFKDNTQVITPPWPRDTSPCFHLYPLQLAGGESVRLRCYNQLKKEGIYAQVHYIPVYWHPYYQEKYGYKRGKCPKAEEYYNRCLSLPLHAEMTIHDAQKVSEILIREAGL